MRNMVRYGFEDVTAMISNENNNLVILGYNNYDNTPSDIYIAII